MSKILDDKSRPSPTNGIQEKKRSRSPSSLIEFAQRKLPKWASFIKKSEEDCESSSKASTPDSSKLKRNVVNEKSKSAEEYDRRNKFIPPKPHSSEEYDRDKRYKGILRRKAVEDSVDVLDSEKLLTPISTKGIRKSPEINEPRTTNKLYAFPFLGRSKERKDCKSEVKTKHKSTESETSISLTPSRNQEKSELNVIVRRQSSSKKSQRPDTKQASFEEKTKSFFKQKSRDKSNESSRKNSVNFGTLKEKYTKWARNIKEDSVKAVSAETLEGVGARLEGFVQGEFLAASMKIFLVVSPPFLRFSIRSRSLSSLDALDSKKLRLLDNHFMARILFGVRPSKQPAWYSSMPDVSSINFTKGMPYHPGPSRGRSMFVRHSRSRHRHCHSASSPRHFFQLSFPTNFENSESMDDRTLDTRRFLNNSVYVPALGHTSLRRAAQNVFDRRHSCGPISIGDYSARINGSAQLYNMESVDTGRLGGAHVTLHDTSKFRFFRKPSYEALPKSSESGRVSSPASNHKESKTPLSQKLKWSNIFRSKENTVNMERLSLILNKFSKKLPRLPFDKQIRFYSMKAKIVLMQMIDIPFEQMIDRTTLTQEEERVQRAIYELISTEVEYIDNMSTLIELFLSVAIHIQSNNLMLEVDLDRLFSNVTEIMQCNILFWETTFYPMIAAAVLHRDRFLHNKFQFNAVYMFDGFALFNEIFHSYKTYVQNQNNSQAYSKQLVQESSLYAAYLTWCEAHKRCKRLRLSDMLVKPMQRLTKYGLLLNSIYNLYHCELEKFTIKKMYRKCRKFIFDLNSHIRYSEEIDAINNITELIESFEGVETKDEDVDTYLRLHTNLRLKDFIKINGNEYHRAIILEGDVKFKDSKDKLEVKAVLFTDFLIFMLPSRRKKSLYKVIRPKYMVSQMKCYPQYCVKDGHKELSSIIIIHVDISGTANGYFTLMESTKENKKPSLKNWLFAIKEAQVTMEMLGEMIQDPREDHYDIDSCQNQISDIERFHKLKGNSTDEDGTLVEPLEAMMPSVIAASKKRLCTMMQGTEAPKHGNTLSAPEIISVPIRPSSLYSQSFTSSLQRSYSGSYECNDWEIVGATILGGSGDTSTGRRTISLSSEEGPTASLLYDIIAETRPPVIVTHGPNISSIQSTTSDGSAHGPKNAPYVAKIVRPYVAVNLKPGAKPSNKTTGKINTLTVEPMHSYHLRQSMPNLSVPMVTSVHAVTTPTRNSLNVPTHSSRRMPRNVERQQHLTTSEKFLSPDSRGTSYPPPSSSRASLRRAFAFSSAGHQI